MPALPAASNFTESGVNEADFKANLTTLIAYLSGLLDTPGTNASALAKLGALGAATVAKTGAYTVVAADRGKVILCSGTFTLSLTAAATLADGFTFAARNTGAGVITIDPNASEPIDGATTITLAAGESCVVVCNGSAFHTLAKSASAAVDVQTFNSSGTWTKPTKGSLAIIEVWGAGGSGSRTNSSSGTGGGGGGYSRRIVPLSSLGATESVAIGAGGAAATATGHGNAGGNTTFGAWLTGYGGSRGLNAPIAVTGFTPGGSGATFVLDICSLGGRYGSPNQFATIVGSGNGLTDENFGGNSASVWSDFSNGTPAPPAIYGGGGGGSYVYNISSYAAGASLYAGAGGAASASYGVAATAGTAPGGGGGAGINANSGAGAAGKCVVTVF